MDCERQTAPTRVTPKLQRLNVSSLLRKDDRIGEDDINTPRNG